MKFTQTDVRSKLTSEGFPFSGFLNPIVAPLIAKFHPEVRSRIYTPEVVTIMMVSSTLSGDNALTAAVIKNNSYRMGQNLDPASVNTAAYSDARLRLEPEVLIQATKQIASKINTEIPQNSIWGNFIPFAIDGSTLTADDTPANQDAFPQHGMQAEGVGFPIIRFVLMQSLRSGMIFDAAYNAFKGKGTGEMSLARELFPNLPENALLLGDRYFPSFFVMAYLIDRGIHGLFPAHAARDLDFRKGKQLSARDHLVEWEKPLKPDWMTQDEYENYPKLITVREVDVSHEVKSKEKFIIVTTLLDNAIFTKSKLAKFYKTRWKIEMAIKDLKDTFNMAHLAAKSPDMIQKVFWSSLLAYNMLRWHILNAAILYGTSIEQVSVKTAATIMTQNGLLILTSEQKDIPELFSKLYFQFVQVPVGVRPGRSEPRAVKRRPKPFPRLHEKRSDWHARRIP